MKRCPECRRDYTDDSLLYCLEDGFALVQGSVPAPGEPVTARLNSPPSHPPGFETEAETKVLTSGSSISHEISRHKLAVAFGVVIAAVVIVGFGYGVYQFVVGGRQTEDLKSPQHTANITTQRLTGDGKARAAEISPDGRFLAYIRTDGDERSIWLKQIQTNSNIPIIKPDDLDGFDNLAFSPDGEFVYFSAHAKQSEAPSIYRAATLGGTPTKVVSDGFAVQFSIDGRHMSYSRFDIAANESTVYIADADGGNERRLSSRSGKQYFDGVAAWSPDGRMLAVHLGDESLLPAPSVAIGLISVADGSVTELDGTRFVNIDDIVWHPSGDSLVVAATEGSFGQSQLFEIAYPSGARRRLTNNFNGHFSVSITRDGNSIVTGEIYSRSAVWVSADLDPKNAKRVMPDTGDTWGFSWTPDNRIVYVSDMTGDPEIWVMNADGSDSRALTNDRKFKTTPVVSPDGRYIVYSPADGGPLVRIDVNGGNRVELASTAGGDNADISPDGKWVIYSAWVDGISRVLRVPINGGERQILKDWATEPRYSRDGTRFACFTPPDTTPNWRRLSIFPAEGGNEIISFEIPTNTNISRGPIWTPDDKGITVIIAPGEKQELWLQPVSGGPGKQMTDIGLPGIARREYSRDGKRIAIVRAQGFGNAIMITDFR